MQIQQIVTSHRLKSGVHGDEEIRFVVEFDADTHDVNEVVKRCRVMAARAMGPSIEALAALRGQMCKDIGLLSRQIKDLRSEWKQLQEFVVAHGHTIPPNMPTTAQAINNDRASAHDNDDDDDDGDDDGTEFDLDHDIL